MAGLHTIMAQRLKRLDHQLCNKHDNLIKALPLRKANATCDLGSIMFEQIIIDIDHYRSWINSIIHHPSLFFLPSSSSKLHFFPCFISSSSFLISPIFSMAFFLCSSRHFSTRSFLFLISSSKVLWSKSCCRMQCQVCHILTSIISRALAYYCLL